MALGEVVTCPTSIVVHSKTGNHSQYPAALPRNIYVKMGHLPPPSFPRPSWGAEHDMKTLVSGPVGDIPETSSPHGVDPVLACFLGSWRKHPEVHFLRCFLCVRHCWPRQTKVGRWWCCLEGHTVGKGLTWRRVTVGIRGRRHHTLEEKACPS